MLLVCYFSCRLLILHRALREGRLKYRNYDTILTWCTQFVHNDVNLAVAWGHEAFKTAVSVLRTFVSQSEVALISTAPDIVFTLVSYAATFVIISKLILCDDHTEHLSASSDVLLAKTIERLFEAAYTPEHHPARCARLIASSLTTLERRKAKLYGGLDDDHVRVAPTVTKSVVPEPAGDSVASLSDLLTTDSIHDFMNSDIFLDTDFWASFMNNISSDPSEDFVLPCNKLSRHQYQGLKR